MKTYIISGFPGIGKTYFKNTFQEPFHDIKILDSDSSKFSWSEPGVRHPDFPNNYIDHIKNNIGKVDIILVSSHEIVRRALERSEINYILIYPDRSLKNEYINRYKNRNSSNSFIQLLDKEWDNFISQCESESFPLKIILGENEHLADCGFICDLSTNIYIDKGIK